MSGSQRPADRPEGAVVAPDPGSAACLDDLVEQLRQLKIMAGDRSYERITSEVNAVLTTAGRPASELAGKTTVVDCFRRGRRRLDSELVLAVVEALHPDAGYVAQWRQAIRVVTGETRAASQVRVTDQLPPDLIGFTGRTVQLDRLRRAVRSGRRVVSITGMAGVGKTGLAIHAGHVLMREEQFDRLLFVNLRGFHPDPAQPPADPSAVLDGFLRLLGLSGQQIPFDGEARAVAYRDRLAGTRTLVVLDNAVDDDQIRPLLPNSEHCLALVTSRRTLPDLHPATSLTLDVFTPAEAEELLKQVAPGAPTGADRRAHARIAQRCGHLPLALGLLAAHVRDTPGWTLTDHADRLDERRRTGHLDSGIELALDLSYRTLPTELRRLLRLAALHPGQEFDGYAAAALTDSDLSTVETALQRLVGDHVIQRTGPHRYALHDLVRAYATERARDEDPPSDHRSALSRLLDYHVASAAAAMDTLYPSEIDRRPKVTRPDAPLPDLTGPEAARIWLDTERPTLVAIATQAPAATTTALSAILMRYLDGGHYADAVMIHRAACQAAELTGDLAAHARALTDLGNAQRQLGDNSAAADSLRRALRLFRQVDDPRGQARATGCLGQVQERLGRLHAAARSFGAARRLYERADDQTGQARASASLGIIDGRLGRHRAAAIHLTRALTLFRQTGNRTRCAYVLINLGEAEEHLGRTGPAADHFQQAVDLFAEALCAFRRAGDHVGEVWSLNSLGDLHLRLGRPDLAADEYRQALTLSPRDGFRHEAAISHIGLGNASLAMGRFREALAHHDAALAVGTPTESAQAHAGLGHAYRAGGDTVRARDHYQQAMTLYQSLESPDAEQMRILLIACGEH
jgi:tetratricopeptide (TPR) repeat protein